MFRLGRRGLALVIALLCAGFGLAAPALAATPTITSFTPTSGPLHTKVTISGTNFTSPATVKFNGVSATSAPVVNSTTITTSVPGTASTGPIRVTTNGTTVTSTASFTVTPGLYLATAVGPPTATTTVYFSGLSAYEAADVYFDTTDLKLVSASSAGAGSVAVAVPSSAAPGTHYFTVVGRKSGYSAQAAFTVRTDWTQYGFDGRSGNNPDEGTLGAGDAKKLALAWQSTVATQPDYGYNEVVAAGGTIFLGNATGVTAVSESTGATLWTQAIGAVTSTPAVSGSTVLVDTTAGHIVALNAATGAVKYNFGFSGETFYRNIVVSGSMFFTEADSTSGTTGSILAFDVANGAQDWSYFLNSYCFGSSVANGILYTTCNNEQLLALNAGSGALVFDVDASEYEHEANPVVANGLVFTAGYSASAGQDMLLAYDATSGDPAWAVPVGVETSGFTVLTVADDEIFMRGENESIDADEVLAFATADGSALWSNSVVPDTDYDPMTVANGLLYVPGGGSTAMLDVATGRRITQVRGGQFAVVTDAGLINALYGETLTRYALPASAYPTERPVAADLRPDRALRVSA